MRIACFGDSLTEGYGLEPGEALPDVLERMLRDEGIKARCLNFGVSGDTASDGLRRIGAVLESAPDAALVEFGANDCFLDEPVPRVEASLAAIIEALIGANIPVLLVGIAAELNPDPDYRAEFDRLFAHLAKRFKLPLFPDILSSYYSNPSLTLMDGLHPNAQGVEAIARALLPKVRKLIEPLG